MEKSRQVRLTETQRQLLIKTLLLHYSEYGAVYTEDKMREVRETLSLLSGVDKVVTVENSY